MFNTIKRMRFTTVSMAVLMLVGILSFQSEAQAEATTTPPPVRTGGPVAAPSAFPSIFYQGFDGNLWGTIKSGSFWLPMTNYGTPSSTVGIASTIGALVPTGGTGLQVWVTGTDGNLWLDNLASLPWSGSSSAWANYGKPSSTVGIASTIGTCKISKKVYFPGWGYFSHSGPGVWVTGTDGNLWLNFLDGSSYSWTNYGKPSSTVGIASTIGTYSVLDASQNPSGQVWVTGTDGNLWLAYQSGSSYAWANYSQPSSTVGIASTIGAYYASDSISGYGWRVWVTGTDGNLWLAFQSGSSYAWANYGQPSSTVGIASTIGAYDILDYSVPAIGWRVWVIGTDGNLWLAYQSGSSYAWASYGHSVGIASTIGATYIPLTLVNQGFNPGVGAGWKVFIIGSDSNLWCAELGTSPASSTWTQLTIANVDHSYLNPKYKILGIDYAPPGSKSNVTYSSNTVRGASTTHSGTFFNSISVTADLSALVSKLSTTMTWTQQYDSSSSDSISITTSKGEVIPGPLYSYLGVDHDLDRIKLWLNPSNVMTVTGPSSARWDGWASNGDDTPVGTDENGIPNMDIVSLSVSQLKNPSTIDPGTALLLARTWDTSGVGGLTSDDFAAILAADPFTNASCNPNDIDANGSRRFDPLGVTINYQPAPPNGQPITQTYSVQNVNTTKVGKGATYSYQVKVEVKAGLGFLGPNGSVSDTFGWTDKRSSEVTSGTGTTASFSIMGPAYTDNYTGPVEFQVWRDNIYGTYMFYPVQ